MKKYISYGIVCFMTLWMILTFVCGFRGIGSSIITYIKNPNGGSVFNVVDGLVSNFESSWNTAVFKKSMFIDVFGLIQKMQGKVVIQGENENTIILKGSDGKLYFSGNVTGATDNVAALNNAQTLSNFSNYCNSKDIEFLSVTAPTKYNSKQVTLPIPCGDLMETSKTFEAELKRLGVSHINLMDKWENHSEFYSDGFFKTDHHWTIETAFWGFQEIVKKLNENQERGQIDEFYCQLSNYNTSITENCYLGSMGVRTGGLYVGRDNITVIKPKFETDFYVYFTTSGNTTKYLERTGTFEQSILNGDSHYGIYVTSDTSLIRIDNKMNDTGRRILLVKDSFAGPIIGWLSTACDELIALDLRCEQEKSVVEYIQEYNIDTVITLYNAEIIGKSSLFNFGEYN